MVQLRACGVTTQALIEFFPESAELNNPWDVGDDPLWLLTPAELELVPEDTILENISGAIAPAGVWRRSEPNPDTKFGYTAYGLRNHQLPRRPGKVSQ